MFKKSAGKSATGVPGDRRGKSAKSDNLYVSPSFIRKFRKFATKKQRSRFSKSTSNSAENESVGDGPIDAPKDAPKDGPKETKLLSNLPKDAAVHFGNFYGIHEDPKKPQPGKIKSSGSAVRTSRTAPRLEFTRQMVHKLERTAGTEEYARQVSALLEETVEPPHFKLHSLPAENSIPDGRHNPSGYPLWYKEPYKMPFTSEIYKLLKEEYDKESKIGKDVFEDSSQEDFWKEFSDEEQIDENESSENLDANKTVEKQESLNALSSSSTSVTEAKDTDSKESVENTSKTKRKISFHI